MTHYEAKKKAFHDIQRIIYEKKRVALVTLYGVMMRRYGYGRKAVDNLIKYLADEDSIEVREGIVYYLLEQKEEIKDDNRDGETDHRKASGN